MNPIQRGQIYYIAESKSAGSEQKGERPAVIVSNDKGNQYAPIVEVVYLTASHKKPLPTHVTVNAQRPSTALCEQVTTVSKDRVLNYVGSVTAGELQQIDDALMISLGVQKLDKKEVGKLDELIKINYETPEPTVSARELHRSLGIEKRFSAWFETNSEGFMEGEDFTSVLTGTVVNNGAVRQLQDYEISFDMAKHICLMSRTEKGRECRQRLIDLEKAWNTPEQIMARALKMADQEIEKLKVNNSQLLEDISTMKPKAQFADAVSASDDSILIRELAKLIKQNGIDIGEKRLFRWMREHKYLISKPGSDYNLPTQNSMDMGLFEIKKTVIMIPDKEPKTNSTPKVTGKGQQYFINKFLRREAYE